MCGGKSQAQKDAEAKAAQEQKLQEQQAAESKAAEQKKIAEQKAAALEAQKQEEAAKQAAVTQQQETRQAAVEKTAPTPEAPKSLAEMRSRRTSLIGDTSLAASGRSIRSARGGRRGLLTGAGGGMGFFGGMFG